jgi:hypothetical protein
MKVLATPCFLEGKDLLGNDRLARNQRYLDYYEQCPLGVDHIVLLDNASSPERIAKLRTFPQVGLMRFDERLKRGPGPHDYPYCWRALWAYQDLIKAGAKKIITIDSDGFVLSERMAKYIRECNSGWVSFYCESGKHPESSIHILNEDTFSIFYSYIGEPWTTKVGTMMEHDLPFTHVETKFRCSRFGERGAPPQDDTMDFYAQAPLSVPLQFGKFL